MKVVDGLGFPERGDFYKLLPSVIRGHDGGLLFAFCELLRKNHSILKEFSRLEWLATDPMSVGKYIAENFSIIEDELTEFLADVQLGNTSPSKPPPSLVDAAHTLEQFRDLLTLLSANVGSEVPLGVLTDSVARSVVASARLRHRTRSSKWFADNIGTLLGLGQTKLQEQWSDNTERNLLPSPTAYPHVAGPSYQYPPGDNKWDGWSPLSEDLERVSLTFGSLSADPGSSTFAGRLINDGNPWVEWNSSGVPSPGVYQFDPESSLKFPVLMIPDLEGDGAATVSSRWATSSQYVEVLVTIDSPTTFTVVITGPVSEVKFKSSFYKLTMFVNLLTSASMLEFSQVGQEMGVSFSALFRPLALLMQEDFAPVTRTLSSLTAGVGVEDQVYYAPHRFVSRVILSDDSGALWKVILSPDKDRPYFLVRPEEGEVSDVAEVRQWDAGLAGYYTLRLTGTGADSTIVPVLDPLKPASGTVESHTVYVHPWFLHLNNGEFSVGVLPLSSDEHLSGDVADTLQLAGTVSDDNSLASAVMTATQPAPAPSLSFVDRPQDVLTARTTNTDQVGFVVGEGWSEDRNSNRWRSGDEETGRDLRMRPAEVIGNYCGDQTQVWLETRDLLTEGFFRHGLLTTRENGVNVLRRVSGDGTFVDVEDPSRYRVLVSPLPSITPGPMEGQDVGNMGSFSNAHFHSYPPISGVYWPSVSPFGSTPGQRTITSLGGGVYSVEAPGLNVGLATELLVCSTQGNAVVRVTATTDQAVTFEGPPDLPSTAAVLVPVGYASNLSSDKIYVRVSSPVVDTVRIVAAESNYPAPT